MKMSLFKGKTCSKPAAPADFEKIVALVNKKSKFIVQN